MTYTEIIAVVQAAKDGKQIQSRLVDTEESWVDCPNPTWNFAKFEYRVKPVWRAEQCERYYYVTDSLGISDHLESHDVVDNELASIGNYFRTHADAELAVPLIKHALRRLHESLDY